MELLAQQLLVGVFTPPVGIPGGFKVTVERLNRIWAEVSSQYGYLQIQLAPDGSGAEIAGSEGEGITIQPPLVQVRDTIELTVAQSADKAQEVIRIIGRHLGFESIFNLGVRLIYHTPVPDKDGRAFVLNRLLGKQEDDLGELAGAGEIWAGLKYFIHQGSVQYTLVIEPLFADEDYVFVDLDGQSIGETPLDTIAQRVADADAYMKKAVNAYLDKH